MSYRAFGAAAEPTSQRLVSSESEVILRVGEEKYARIVELQKRHLQRVRLDWRFWVGLAMSTTGAAFLFWRPDLKAAGRRAEGRLKKVAAPVTRRIG